MIPTQEPSADAGRPAPDLETVRAAFPQFEVIELIGRGGMGAVYKVRQPQLDRFVALKILTPPPGSDRAFAERFQREAKALARLSHPHIVTIHDFGQAGGFFYLLMEFVDGVNLRQAIRAKRFTPAQALAVVPPICEALQYAHEHGIVHRDIKPENLLLDKVGRLKIADFGIAKMMEGSDPSSDSTTTSVVSTVEEDLGLTQGNALGTPQYMAPEQRTPDQSSTPVDHRADIYSLGVVLYELLTGELPTARLEPPSRRVQIDVRLDDIVLRALEAEPNRRYRTAHEFKTQIEGVATAVPEPPSIPAGEPPSASPPLPRSTAQPAPKRPRWVLAAALIFLLCVLSAALLPTIFAPREYFAKATIELKRDPADFTYTPGTYDPQFIRVQAEIMRKTAILHPVIERLDLVRQLSRPEKLLTQQDVYLRLVRSMVVQEVRNTGLIEIGCFDTDPRRAADIANSITAVYQEKRFADVSQNMERGLQFLDDELIAHRQIVEDAAAVASRLRVESNIADPDPESATVTLPAGSDQAAIERYKDAKARYLQARLILENVELTLQAERIKRKATVPQGFRIWEKAEVPAYPVRWSAEEFIDWLKRRF